MRGWLLLLALVFPAVGHAATYTASTCNRADVVAALSNVTVNGDIVEVPNGSCIWTSPINLPTIAMTLKAQNAPFVDANDRPIAHNVTITDGSSWASPSGAGLLRWVTGTGGLHRISGINWVGASGPGSPAPNTVFRISGNTQSFRFDHNTVTLVNNIWFNISGWVNGVLDHNIFHQTIPGVFVGYAHQDAVNDNPNGCGGGVVANGCGDAAWAAVNPVGENCLFNESNAYDRGGSTSTAITYAWDGWAGHCMVHRYNRMTDIVFANHGNDSSGRSGGLRYAAVYENQCDYPYSTTASVYGFRGGSGFVYNNTCRDFFSGAIGGNSNGFLGKIANFSAYRFSDCTEGLGGTSNPACSGPWWRQDPISVTITSSGTTATVTCPGVSCYMNYSPGGSPPVIPTVVISGNANFNGTYRVTGTPSLTTFTFTFSGCSGCSGSATASSAWDGSTTGYPGLQQVGRGQGTLIGSGGDPGVGSWSNQMLFPVYTWNNTRNGSLCPGTGASCSYSAVTTGAVRHDRDWYAQQGVAGDGTTTGVGVGASLPATCTTGAETGGGVGYWHTVQRRLYRCSATNTWTVHYTEPTFPHSLVSGGGGATPSSAIILLPLAGSSQAVGATFGVTGTAVAGSGSLTKVSVYIDGSLTCEDTVAPFETWSCNATAPLLEGIYTLTARATDAGGLGPASSGVSFTALMSANTSKSLLDGTMQIRGSLRFE